MNREETLLNVIKSVTRNGRSIVLTAVLGLILVYLFSIVGYMFFKDDFILEVNRISNGTLGNSHSHRQIKANHKVMFILVGVKMISVVFEYVCQRRLLVSCLRGSAMGKMVPA